MRFDHTLPRLKYAACNADPQKDVVVCPEWETPGEEEGLYAPISADILSKYGECRVVETFHDDDYDFNGGTVFVIKLQEGGT